MVRVDLFGGHVAFSENGPFYGQTKIHRFCHLRVVWGLDQDTVVSSDFVVGDVLFIQTTKRSRRDILRSF